MTFDCNSRNTPGCTNNCEVCPLVDQCYYCSNIHLCYEGIPSEDSHERLRGVFCEGSKVKL